MGGSSAQPAFVPERRPEGVKGAVEMRRAGFVVAVGAPLESAGSAQAVGAISVFYASGGGVLTPGPAFLQGSGGLGGTAEAFDFFGSALE